jgi:hypothetical protein
MYERLQLSEKDGLYTTILPPFADQSWSDVVPSTGFVWIRNPHIDFTGRLDSIVRSALFGAVDIDLRCSLHRIDLDISIPAVDFLRIAGKAFAHGLYFIHSAKHQPVGFQLAAISKSRWPSLMASNKISLLFHRPAGGEPSLVTSSQPQVLTSIIERFSSQQDGVR